MQYPGSEESAVQEKHRPRETGAEEDAEMGDGLGMVGFFIMVIVLVVLTKRYAEWEYNQPELRFARTFGIEPEPKSLVRQRLVNTILQELAGAYAAADTTEQYRQKEIRENRPLHTTPGDVHYCEQQLATAHEVVQVAKKAFWDAHELAKSFNFRVLESYKDYALSLEGIEVKLNSSPAPGRK